MARRSSSKLVVYAAASGNALIAISKFVAAAYTGSFAMLSEAVHSVADTGNQLLLLYGMHRARQPPDERHPLGHGRELYFLELYLAPIMFNLGAGVTLYEGVQHVFHPSALDNRAVNYIVLACAAVFEGTRWTIATPKIEDATAELEHGIQAALPEVIAVFVKPQSAAGGQPRRVARIAGAGKVSDSIRESAASSAR